MNKATESEVKEIMNEGKIKNARKPIGKKCCRFKKHQPPENGNNERSIRHVETRAKDNEINIDDNFPKPTSENQLIERPSSDVEFRSMSDFDTLNEVSAIMNDLEKCKELIYMTRKEKRCLEEIASTAKHTRVPLDSRQMIFYNKEANKFDGKISLPESGDVPDKNYNQAAGIVKESASKILATEVTSLNEYLRELKNLIARREVAWAATTDNDYAQKVEIMRLKNEVSHLRVLCSKRQAEIDEKTKLISEKNSEINRMDRLIQKLKIGIINLEKNAPTIEDDENNAAGLRHERKSKIGELLKDIKVCQQTTGMVKVPKFTQTSQELRKNPSPAALLANALHRARIAGNNVNF